MKPISKQDLIKKRTIEDNFFFLAYQYMDGSQINGLKYKIKSYQILQFESYKKLKLNRVVNSPCLYVLVNSTMVLATHLKDKNTRLEPIIFKYNSNYKFFILTKEEAMNHVILENI